MCLYSFDFLLSGWFKGVPTPVRGGRGVVGGLGHAVKVHFQFVGNVISALPAQFLDRLLQLEQCIITVGFGYNLVNERKNLVYCKSHFAYPLWMVGMKICSPSVLNVSRFDLFVKEKGKVFFSLMVM